jgi:DNA-binding IclR family transcriptional regulator
MDKAFIKGLRLLEVLANSEQPRGITDLATELGLTKSNVHRLLQTLQANGFVRQIPASSAYELTTKMWELGNRVMRRIDLNSVARPAMIKLAEATGETVHLSILVDTDVIYIDKIESSHHIRAFTHVGSKAPAFAVATGKAMLAHLPDKYLEKLVPLFSAFTDYTRVSLVDLKADISLIREQGYALVPHGEWRDGIAACACAILDRNGDIAGAIGISGPDSRLKKPDLQEIAPLVVAAARSISRALGHSGQFEI